jgi:transcriptional regulator
MAAVEAGSLYGTLELLSVKSRSSRGPLHGVAIADHIGQQSGDVFQIEEGSLYPALHRVQAKGLVEWEWLTSEKGKRAKFYSLTARGRKALQRGVTNWVKNTRATMSVFELAWDDVR